MKRKCVIARGAVNGLDEAMSRAIQSMSIHNTVNPDIDSLVGSVDVYTDRYEVTLNTEKKW